MIQNVKVRPRTFYNVTFTVTVMEKDADINNNNYYNYNAVVVVITVAAVVDNIIRKFIYTLTLLYYA